MSCVKKEQKANKVNVETNGEVYHEKQSRELCALHALNNLFQEGKTFTKQQLDEICLRLSPDTYINPHQNMLGLGNYDINVIMAALQTKECDTIWFDKRKDVYKLRIENIKGFILNVPTDLKWGFVTLPIRRKHWIAVRQIADNFYNLDSKLDAPELIGRDAELRAFLREEIQCKEKELLLVVSQQVAEGATWYRQRPDSAAKQLENGYIVEPKERRSSRPKTPSQAAAKRKDDGIQV